MNPILKKLSFKGQSPVLLLGTPLEFKKNLKDLGAPVHTQVKGKYGFILIFVKSVSEGEKAAKVLKKAAAEGR